MPSLQELTDLSSIRLEERASTWQEALEAAGSLLTEAGVSGPAYTRAMIANVEDKGPYIVVAPGFAFAHARATDDVTRTGMAWIRLARPVRFGHASNDPVSLVGALAATDSSQHVASMKQLARLLGDSERRAALDEAASPQQFLNALSSEAPGAGRTATRASATHGGAARDAFTAKNMILTVCGNGLGTSLFLKNTLEQVLDRWGWSPYLTVEATDTISAKGKAKEADLILTSGEIARTLGDLGVPVRVIENFTSAREVDAVMRDSYDV